MNLSDYVRVYDQTLSPSTCESLIASFQADVSHHIYNCDDIKKFTEINVVQAGWDIQDVTNIAQLYRQKYWHDCNIIEPMIDPDHSWEEFRIKQYRVAEQEQFEPHNDVYNLKTARRFMVMMWYLNDVVQGGETEFYRLDRTIKIQPQQGRLVMFPCTWQYLHAGLAPISNDKYIIGTYFHYQ